MQVDKKARTRREQAAEETKEALLQAGKDLLLEKFRAGELDALRLLSPTEIATRADRGMALLYHHWPVAEGETDKLARYRRALFLRLALEAPFDVEALLDEAGQHLAEPFPDLVRATANFEVDRFGLGPLHWNHRLSILLTIFAEARGDMDYVDIRGSVADPNNLLATGYQRILDHYGREMIPPLTCEHLAQMLGPVLDGFAINAWCLEKAAARIQWHEAPGPWTPFALAVWAIADKVTRPKKRPRRSSKQAT